VFVLQSGLVAGGEGGTFDTQFAPEPDGQVTGAVGASPGEQFDQGGEYALVFADAGRRWFQSIFSPRA